MDRIKLSIINTYDIFIKNNEKIILNISPIQAFSIDGINTIGEINNLIKTHLLPINNMDYDVWLIDTEDTIIDVIPIQDYIKSI